jgi:uncharacterized protein YxjI
VPGWRKRAVFRAVSGMLWVKGGLNGKMCAMRYLVREKGVGICDDFSVSDENGREVFRVDPQAMQATHPAFDLTDPSGAVVTTIRKQLLAMTEMMAIERAGTVIATVRKAVVAHIHHRFVVDLPGGGALEAHGDIAEKEFEIRHGPAVLARVSRTWFRVRHSYGVDVAPGQDDPLLLAVTVCLDRIHHDEAARRYRC